MKLLLALLVTLALIFTPSSERKLNNTVADSKIDKESRVVVTNSSKKEKKQAKPVKKKTVHEGTVTPLVTSSAPNCDAHDKLLARYFGDDIRIAKAVMQAESGCRSDAVGDGHLTYVENGITYGMSCGLFQIRYLPGRKSCETHKQPEQAIRTAAEMWRTSGWQPWSAYLNGSYIKFLK